MTAVADKPVKPMSKTKWIAWATKQLKERFADNAWIETLYKGVERIHSRQTADEQNRHTTVEDNGMGWSGTDAEFMTSMANQLAEWRKNQKYPCAWSSKQLLYVRRIMMRYAGQLARVAWENKQRGA